MIMNSWALLRIDNPFISVALYFPRKGHLKHLSNNEYFTHLEGVTNSFVTVALVWFCLFVWGGGPESLGYALPKNVLLSFYISSS